MSGYQRINFKDQNVERPKTYDIINNPDGSITLIDSFGNIEELGTPINAENMNHIEDAIDAVSFSKFNIDFVFKKEDLITDIQDNELKIYKSLKDDNFGHLPSETEYWEEVEIAGGKGSGFNLFDIKISDHILEGNEAKGWALQGTYVTGALYPDFYNECLAQRSVAVETDVTLGENTITIFKHNNGHQFFNIADKSVVDTFFDTFGIADFYGIDEENERVFLPRNKYFQQLTLNTDEVNNMVEAGSPNIIGSSNGVYCVPASGIASSGALYASGSTLMGPNSNINYDNGIINFDASRSNTIYGNSDTVQPPSSLKLLYFCVGNTVVNDANIDAGELTAQMETKANIQLDNVLPSQEFKNQSISWGIVDLPKQANPFNANKIAWNTVFQLPCDAMVAIGGTTTNNNTIILLYSYDSNVDSSYNTYKTNIFDYRAPEYIATTVGVFPKGIYLKAMGGSGYQHLSYIPLKGVEQ